MKLKDSREMVKLAIEQQIAKGEKEFLSGEVESAEDFSIALGELKTAFQVWNSHNITLLRAKFDDENIQREYNPRISATSVDLYNPPDELEQYNDLRSRVSKKISILKGFIGKLDLYEERPMYGASGGRLDAFHSEVVRVAGKSLKDGNLRAALIDAFIALDNYVQTKSSYHSATGTSLMQTVFSGNSPILQLSSDQEEQTGFMMLYAGAIKAIRNQYAHNVVSPSDEQEAMEWLGFASALFRLVDQAKKVAKP